LHAFENWSLETYPGMDNQYLMNAIEEKNTHLNFIHCFFLNSI